MCNFDKDFDRALALDRQKLLALGADPGPTAENIDLDLELPETGAMATAKQQLDTLGVPYTQKERRSPDKPRLHGDLLDAVHGALRFKGDKIFSSRGYPECCGSYAVAVLALVRDRLFAGRTLPSIQTLDFPFRSGDI
jgi:hypothetical protein